MKTFIACFCIAILLSSCATTQKLSDFDRKRIAGVLINADVKVIPDMYYMGSSSTAGFMSGAIGGVVSAIDDISQSRKLKLLAENNEIYIEKIVIEEMRKAIGESGKINIADSSSSGTAQLNILIPQYGFSIPHGFSSKLVPVLHVTCEMLDSSGKRIWKWKESVSILNSPAEPVALEQIQADPGLIEHAWRMAAEDIAKRMINNY
ncbi:MAG: hypothetical protein ACU841_13855 [Gammaproteobacteria bacterium]